MNGLKVCFLVDSHSLTGYGMREFQSLGMQIQPFGFLSVELIADNGAVQSERMGGMHPELMGASGAGIKGDAGMIVLAFQHFKVDRKSTRLNSSHRSQSRMPSSA